MKPPTIYNFYQQELKEEYLKTIDNKSAKGIIRNVFGKNSTIEEMFGKDLYLFSTDEFKDVFYNMDASTDSAIKAYGNALVHYIDWAIKNSLKQGNINQLRYLESTWYAKFIDRSKKLIFSESEIKEVVKESLNTQDSVIPSLVFDGVGGKELSELLNLQKKDVNFDTGVLTLRDDNGRIRTLKVGEQSIRLIEGALDKNTPYYAKNGQSTSRSSVRKIIDNDYVIRNSIGRNQHLDKVKNSVVYGRLSILSEFFNYRHFNPKNIVNSGKLKLGLDLYLERGKITKDELTIIAEHFGDNKAMVNGKLDYNYDTLGKVVNETKLSLFYPEEFHK